MPVDDLVGDVNEANCEREDDWVVRLPLAALLFSVRDDRRAGPGISIKKLVSKRQFESQERNSL